MKRSAFAMLACAFLVTGAVLLLRRTGNAPAGRLAIQYPLNGTLFPPEIHPPTFTWSDETPGVEAWRVVVELVGRDELVPVVTDEPSWRPDASLWQTVKRGSVTADARVVVRGIKRGESARILSSGAVSIRTSRDEVGAPIFYRDVPLPFIYAVRNPDTIRWRLGSIASERPAPVVLRDLPVCGNCHSFSADGRTLGMDVDYANDKGSYIITAVEEETFLSRDRVITWSDFRRDDEEPTFGLLSSISPDGRYAISTVKDRSVFVPKEDLAYSQLFFPIKGILAFYDRQTREFAALPGADDPRYVQSNPSWTPDGKHVVFVRARAEQLPGMDEVKGVLLPPHLAAAFIAGLRSFQFDIYRIPFNGGRGGNPEPVAGASNNGMSNYFPRISPDGRWMVFSRARSFMLLQPDSALYLVRAEGGTPRRMTCNTSNMNSWHSWSPNSRWLVFSSKARGPYTQLFLTHVDENGNDSPPVLLENMSLDGRAANIPEFINIPPDGIGRIVERFLDDYSFIRGGDNLIATFRDYKKAVEYYEKVIRTSPGNVEAHVRLGLACIELGEMSRAEQTFLAVARLQPSNLDVHAHLGIVYLRTRRYAEARKEFESVVEKRPRDVDAHVNLGAACANQGDLGRAEALFRKAARLAPENVSALISLGMVLEIRSRHGEARGHFRAALKHAWGTTEDALYVAEKMVHREEFAKEVIGMLRELVQRHPHCGPAHVLLSRLHLREGDLDSAIQALEEVWKIKPSRPWVWAKITELKERRQREQGK